MLLLAQHQLNLINKLQVPCVIFILHPLSIITNIMKIRNTIMAMHITMIMMGTGFMLSMPLSKNKKIVLKHACHIETDSMINIINDILRDFESELLCILLTNHRILLTQ